MVTLIFGILWLIKGEIKIRKTPWWEERFINASNGRMLGAIMVLGNLMPLCVPLSDDVAIILAWIFAILPIVVGIALSEKPVEY